MKISHMRRVAAPNKLAIALLLLATTWAGPLWAEPLPNAGSQLQGLPNTPEALKPKPDFQLETLRDTETAPQPAGNKVLIKHLQLQGNTLFSDAILLAACEFKQGVELDLAGLRALAGRISRHYHNHGYFLAQTYIPPQEIKDGLVQLTVVEGRYGQVKLNDAAGLNSSVAAGMLGNLHEGNVVEAGDLESGILRFSDLPGVKVNSTLVPGASVGTSDLIIDLQPGARLTGSVDIDNAGSKSTGEYRLGSTLNLNNSLGLGDVATLRVLSSFDGLDYARGAYQFQAGAVRLGAAYSWMGYKLGDSFASLDAYGSARIASLYVSYPLLRSRQRDLSLQLAFDEKKLVDRIGVTDLTTEKKIHVLMAGLLGNSTDSLGGGGINNWNLTWTYGDLDIFTGSAQAVDAITAQTAGHYNKLGYAFSRLQNLNLSWSLFTSVTGQSASHNLDSSEKMALGGSSAVRAYAEGTDSGDVSQIASLEIRYLLPLLGGMPGQVQMLGFVDAGHTRLNKSPWTPSDDEQSLYGAGLGVNWFAGQNLMVKSFYAHPITPPTGMDSNGRFWLQGVVFF